MCSDNTKDVLRTQWKFKKRKISGKHSNIWKLNNTVLHNPCVKGENEKANDWKVLWTELK